MDDDNGDCRVDIKLREARKALDNEIARVQELLEVRLKAIETATIKASQEMDRRLEGMNEFREQLRQQAMLFMNREEYTLGHTRLVDDIRSLRESRSELEGKASATSVYIAYALAGVGLLLSAISLFH